MSAPESPRKIRGFGLAEREGDDRKGDTRDPANTRSESVEAVQEVDHVHDRDDPDEREQNRQPVRQGLDAEERECEAVDVDAEVDRDRRRRDLTAELPPPGKPAEVVHHSHSGRNGGPEEDAPVGVI
jgi:hypothetical protein